VASTSYIRRIGIGGRTKKYPFMNSGIEPRGIGRELAVLDPASNQIRFFEPGSSNGDD